ncbi:CCA tRNA nucleotidyltransferase [Kordiimonas sp.]|uniref:CCA tRNA nucleotidyltransferase n=1 Tax=Kordiimonas sp. TaxID=1970157 RepID=UPI003A8DB383
MAKKIHADWLTRPLVKQVLEVLGPDNMRFVGGAVRDTFLGRPVKDIDAACRLHPQVTMELLERSGIKVVPTGIAHGTVTAVLDDETIEITTLRSDLETDGRHAKVAFTEDWQQDASRRDFTFNALYLTSCGEIFDPFGGIADLEAGRVRFIGVAEERIMEDALRIMRFFRFHAWYGAGALDDEGLAACQKHIALLESLSGERIRDELLKILMAPDPLPSLCAFVDIGGADVLKLGLVNTARLKTYITHEQQRQLAPDPILRLACWLSVKRGGVKALASDLRFSNKERSRLYSALEGVSVAPLQSPSQLRALYYRFGRDAANVAVMAGDEEPSDLCLDVLNNWQVPTLPVKGGDLVALGKPEGPEISRRLRELEMLWVESDFSLSKDDLLAQI